MSSRDSPDKSMQGERILRAGHLFSGAGGIKLGFEQAGIETAWETDILYGEDIRETETYSREFRVDIITGGPPCVFTSQAASLSGKKTNQSLWSDMLRFIKGLEPRWVFVEQPASVDRHIIGAWVQDLQRCGYGVTGRIINSQHWLPQRRNRWFVIGRVGISGVALWDYLYTDCLRVQGGFPKRGEGKLYPGLCPDCMPGGIFARISSRALALVGAGNAVSVPVARWLALKILQAENGIKEKE